MRFLCFVYGILLLNIQTIRLQTFTGNDFDFHSRRLMILKEFLSLKQPILIFSFPYFPTILNNFNNNIDKKDLITILRYDLNMNI